MAFTAADKSGNPVATPLFDPAYSYAFTLTAAQTAAPTTLFQLQGVAGTVVRVKYLQIMIRSGTAASTAATVFTLNRRSTAATGGTAVSNTIAKHDVNNATAGAVASHFTAAPTAGTLVAALRRWTATLAGTAADNTDQIFTYQCTDKGDQPFVLRGALDFLTIDLAVALSTGQDLDVNVQWEEDSARPTT